MWWLVSTEWGRHDACVSGACITVRQVLKWDMKTNTNSAWGQEEHRTGKCERVPSYTEYIWGNASLRWYWMPWRTCHLCPFLQWQQSQRYPFCFLCWSHFPTLLSNPHLYTLTYNLNTINSPFSFPFWTVPLFHYQYESFYDIYFISRPLSSPPTSNGLRFPLLK